MFDGYDVLGSDGVPVTLCALQPAFWAPLLDLLGRLSTRTLRARFLGSGVAVYQTYVEELFDPQRTLDAAVACVGGAVVAVGSTHRVGADAAEIAVLVDDDHQHHGIGTLALEDLDRPGPPSRVAPPDRLRVPRQPGDAGRSSPERTVDGDPDRW
jgi:hypothetical protein